MRSSTGLAPSWNGDIMSDKDASKDNSEDEDDWMSYANAGFGSTDYSLWDDSGEDSEIVAEPEWDEENLQLDTGEEEIPAAPRPAGLKHLVRIGTCNHCLGRIGGKKRFGQSNLESGLEVRNLVVETDSTMAQAREKEPLCPFCENLFEESELLADIIFDNIAPYELSRLQLGARIPKDQIQDEEDLRKRFGAGGSDALKSSLVQAIAQHLNTKLENVTLVNDLSLIHI